MGMVGLSCEAHYQSSLWSEPKPHVASVAAWNIDVFNVFMKRDEPVDLGDILFIFVPSKSRNSKFSRSGACPPATSDIFLMQPAGVHGSRPCDHVVLCPRFCELSSGCAAVWPYPPLCPFTAARVLTRESSEL